MNKIKIRFMGVSIIAIIIIASVIVFIGNTNETKERLFSEEEINAESIERVEVIDSTFASNKLAL